MTSDSLIGKRVRIHAVDWPVADFDGTCGTVRDYFLLDIPDPVPYLVVLDNGTYWHFRESEIEPIEEERHAND